MAKMTTSSLYSVKYIVAEPRPPMQPTHHGGRNRMPIPAIRFRVYFARRQAVGPGKIALLERIGRTGSLSQAARDLHMSYRRAWLLLESLNASFRERVALSSRGGRGGGGVRRAGFGRQ